MLFVACQAVPAFATPPPEPQVLSASASSPSRAGVVLSGAVNPEGESTFYDFEYGPTAAYGSRTTETSAGSASAETPVGPTTVTGLHPGTTYHFRLVALSPGGTAFSEDATFTTSPPTPPLVTTGAATGVSEIAATISASIDPQGLHTTYEFELGPTASYGSEFFGDAGSGSTTESFQVNVLFLTPGTTYHFRVEAANEDGAAHSIDETFTTPVYPMLAPQQPPAKPLTRAQRLTRALKACRRKPPRRRRACVREAHRRYGPLKKHHRASVP
jgi:hypothetical protein